MSPVRDAAPAVRRSGGRVAVWVLVTALAASCRGKPPGETVLTGTAMGTAWAVKYHGAEASDAEVEAAVAASLEATDRSFSTWRPDSLISRFNAHASLEPFAVDAEFTAVLRLALELAAATDGGYDPTVLPLVRVLGFGPGGDGAAPSEAEVATALERIGWQRIEILAADRVRKTDATVELDLSSVAKGYGVDAVGVELERLGADGYMVDIGGEVRCRGTKADGTPWRIGIEEPQHGGTVVHTAVELHDRSLATSGSYRNFRESGGVVRHHIPDARTGRNPEHRAVSVSVEAATCALADGLATALMIVGPEHAHALLSAFDDEPVRALFLVAGDDGAVVPVGIDW